jgi:biotin carboxyl carrier protein
VPATRPPAPEPAALAQPTNSVPASAPATAAPAPAAAAPTDAAPEPAPAAPRERAELSTLSPLSVKRPGRVLFDLRGSGLASDLQARLVAVRDAPKGLSVVRQKCSGTLCNVLVELDESVKPAIYAIVLEDPQGRQTNVLTFTVTR